MNCKKHPDVAAVAQCPDCGVGLCVECADMYRPSLCEACFSTRKSREITNHIFRLVFYIVLFIVGYKLNFMASKATPEMSAMSGYVLMAILSGYVFVNNIFVWKMISGTGIAWLIYFVFKLALYSFVGFFTAPFTVGWTIFKLIRAVKL